MIPISVLIITYNEEKNINLCLSSIKGIADEIIVVDSYSTDKTKEICLAYNVQFYEHPFETFVQQKNFAIDQAKYNYVLSLDADEVLDDEAIRHIALLKSQMTMDEAYSISRKTFIGKRWIRYAGWYPDAKVRLWNKSKARWGGANPHERLLLDADVKKPSRLKGNLLHYSYQEIDEVYVQNMHYASLAADFRRKNNRPSSLFTAITHGAVKFIKTYIIKLGLLEGKYGLKIAWYYTLSTFKKYYYF